MLQDKNYEKLIKEIGDCLSDNDRTVAEVAGSITNILLFSEQIYGEDFYFEDPSLNKLFEVSTHMEWQPEAYGNRIEAMQNPFEEFRKRINAASAF